MQIFKVHKLKCIKLKKLNFCRHQQKRFASEARKRQEEENQRGPGRRAAAEAKEDEEEAEEPVLPAAGAGPGEQVQQPEVRELGGEGAVRRADRPHAHPGQDLVPEPQVQEQAQGPGQVGADGRDEEHLLPDAVPGHLHGRAAAPQRHYSAPGVQPRFPRQRPAAASPALPERSVPAARQLHGPAELYRGAAEVPAASRFLCF